MELNQLVFDEATKLRQHATSEEKDRLDFFTLNPDLIDGCIYGQMTGNCYADRAKELLLLCAQPYSDRIIQYEEAENDYFIGGIFRAFSPIEFYIYQKGSDK